MASRTARKGTSRYKIRNWKQYEAELIQTTDCGFSFSSSLVYIYMTLKVFSNLYKSDNTRECYMERNKKYNWIPTKLSEKSFTSFILPHLLKGKRGPEKKLSFYSLFCYIMALVHK